MATGWEVERERTYDLAAADAPGVHRILAPGPATTIGGEPVPVRARPANLVLHVYSRLDDDDRRRVLVELTGRRRIRLSEKHWGVADGEPVKFDRRRRIRAGEAWAELAGHWLAAFVKARFPLELRFRSPSPAVLVARIDVMVPVDGSGAPCPDRLFTQVEIESRAGGADPGAVEADPGLWRVLGPLLTPATRTKADLAGGAGPGPAFGPRRPAPAWSATETAARVAAIADAVPALATVEPIATLATQHAALDHRGR
jgi:hypothetical protein